MFSKRYRFCTRDLTVARWDYFDLCGHCGVAQHGNHWHYLVFISVQQQLIRDGVEWGNRTFLLGSQTLWCRAVPASESEASEHPEHSFCPESGSVTVSANLEFGVCCGRRRRIMQSNLRRHMERL